VPPTPAPAPAQLPAEQPAEPVAEPEPEGVTLKVWDIMTRPEESAIMEELIARFEEANPGVTVAREAKNLDDLKATTGLALSSPDGPDVVMANQGQSDMGAFVAAGLLLPLDDYAAQYGWSEVFPEGLAALNSWTLDGAQMGEGNFYGLPIQAELVGVYYRTDLFEENGIEIPRTLAEFEAAMDTLKEAGVTPLVFGNLDGWPAIHLYSELQNAELGEREWYDDFMYLRNAVSFNQPANVAAAARLQEWIDKGYFNEGFAGIAYDDSWPIFSAGEGAMYLTGSWLAGELLAGPNADNFGFFLLPPLEEDGYKLSVGGTGLAFAIRHDTPNADLAAEYIDYLFSPETAEAMFTRGLLPVYPVDPALAQDRLSSDLVAAWAALNENNAIGYYMDWVTPTMYDTITASLQELMAKRLTPEEFVAKVDADYQAFLAEKAE
jgi:raffinose/stachyose/melibiose transport system substrate-binding protein